MKKKNLITTALLFFTYSAFSENINVEDSVMLEGITVTSVYRNGKLSLGSYIDRKNIVSVNHGQEPSHILSKTPGIYSYGDNGTQFGYNYFRLRGLGQERINYTIDGLPLIQESEDFGCYFSNMPDLLSSMKSLKVERGSGVTTSGSVSYAGNISFESVDTREREAYVDMGIGNFGTSRITGVYTSGRKGNFGIHLRGTMLGTGGYKEHSGNTSKAFTTKIEYFLPSGSIDLFSTTGYHKNGQSFIGLSDNQLPSHPKPFGKIPNGNSILETDNFLLTSNKIQYKGWIGSDSFLSGAFYWSSMKGDYRMVYDGLWNYGLLHHMYGMNILSKTWIFRFTFTTGLGLQRFQRRHTGTELPGDTIIDHFHSSPLFPERYINKGFKNNFDISERVEYKPLDDLSIQANIQYRRVGLDYKVTKEFNSSDIPFKYTWNFINTGLDIYFKPIPGNTLYFKWATVSKEPSRTDILGGEYNTGEFSVSDPGCSEKVNDIELGLEFKKDRLECNIGFYYMKFSNELVATGELSKQNGLPLHLPLDGYRTGLELSCIYRWSNLLFTENLVYSKNKLDSYGTHPYSPSLISYSGIDYSCRRFMVGLDLNLHSKKYVDLENKFSIPKVISLGGYVGYNFGRHIELKLSLTNITNRLNISNGSTDGKLVYYNVDTPFALFGNIKIKL